MPNALRVPVGSTRGSTGGRPGFGTMAIVSPLARRLPRRICQFLRSAHTGFSSRAGAKHRGQRRNRRHQRRRACRAAVRPVRKGRGALCNSGGVAESRGERFLGPTGDNGMARTRPLCEVRSYPACGAPSSALPLERALGAIAEHPATALGRVPSAASCSSDRVRDSSDLARR